MQPDTDLISTLLGRDLTDNEYDKISYLARLGEAVIVGYCGHDFPDPVPDAVQMVLDQMIAASLQRAASLDGEDGVTQKTTTAGPYSESRSYSPDYANSLGVWLTAGLKLMLDPYRSIEGFRTVSLSSTRFSDCNDDKVI